MSWWGNSWGGVYQGGALQNPDKGVQRSGPATIRTDANITVTDERAMMVSAVFACVRLLVQTGATLPLGFFERTTDGREVLDDGHYLWQLLKYQPNNFMTAKEFRQAMWTQRVLWGNAYAYIKWMGKRPVSLTPLKPEFMTVIRGDTGLIYRYSIQSGVKEYPQKQIFHLKGFSADGITGLSALAYARHTMGISVSADRYASKSFSGAPNGTLNIDVFLEDEQRDKLRRIYGGLEPSSAYNADGQMMILEGGLKYNQVGLPPDDLQMLESRQWQVPEIARFFGVPAVMIDGSAGSVSAWPASYEQQVLNFLTFTLKPYLEEWEDKIPASLLLGTERRTIISEHNVEGLLRTDSEKRANFYSKMVQNGLLSRNEVRIKENMPPVKGADELTVQVNMTNLEDLPQVNQNVTE